MAQCLDGVLTYTGVLQFGPGIEANPLMRWLMQQWGEGPGLTLAKSLASGFGIALHLASVHRVVFALTAVYVAGALLPWMILLFGL